MTEPITIKTIATIDKAVPINEFIKSFSSEYEAWTSRDPDERSTKYFTIR